MGGIRKVGEWKKVSNLVNVLSKEMEIAQKTALKQTALYMERQATSHLSKQDLGWAKLQPKTIATKIRKGLSTNILIATSDYFQGITSWVKDNVAYAGVKKDAKNREGDSLTSIAAVHEFGSKSGNLPARPLWRPVFAEAVKFAKKVNPSKIFMQNIRKWL